MSDKKHDDRVTEIAGEQNADEAPQVFKVGQMGSAQSGRRDFLKNALAGTAAGVSATTIGGCDNPHTAKRESDCTSTFVRSLTGPVESLAISPDSRLLASGGNYGDIKLWSLPDGGLLKILTENGDPVNALAISPDGTMLASGIDISIKLWSLPDGVLLKTLSDAGFVNAVAISPDGTRLASSTGSDVILRTLPDGAFLKTLKGHFGSVAALAISPDGTMLVSSSADKTIKLWSLPDGALLKTLPSSGGGGVAISPDGTILVSGGGGITLWRLPDGVLLKTLPGSGGSGVAISPDGAMLIVGLSLLSLPDGELLQTLTGHTVDVAAIAISPDGTTLASGGRADAYGYGGGRIELWSLPSGALRSDLVDPASSYTGYDHTYFYDTCSPGSGAMGCTCNTVCSCDSVCTCNTVCTCDSEGGGGGSYYYPD